MTDRTLSPRPGGPPPAIGPIGVGSRVSVGLLLIGLALFWRDPSWTDAGLAAGIAAIVTSVAVLRARRNPESLDATGPFGYLVNSVVFISLLTIPATAGAGFLFYGVSMLVAAARRSGGCEITAIANALLDRDDEVGCVLFGPVDSAEARLDRARPRSRSVMRN